MPKQAKYLYKYSKDVAEFHEKFGRNPLPVAGFLPTEQFEVKLGHLQEEIDEIVRAYAERNLGEFLDGLVDLIYVAIGTAHLSGLPLDEAWDAVHAANMAKVRAKDASESKRGDPMDIIKPPGWTKPDIDAVLKPYVGVK